MSYVRPSALGVAEFCPRSAEMNELSGISREAVISSAWHARCAGNDTLIGELHPDERKEALSYGIPTPAQVTLDGDTFLGLDYDSAEKELHVQVLERDTLITEGTLDFAWVRTVSGRKWAFVADLKRNTWSIPDGPDCLQLAAYGHAYSHLRGCDGYTPGLWSGTESEWTWGTPVDLTSPDALDLWLRIKRAAKNDARLHPNDKDKQRFVTGAHCSACYGRMKCREYLLPAWGYLAKASAGIDVDEELRVNIVVAEDTAAELLTRAKVMEEYAELIKENVKVFAERGGSVVDPVTGKRFLPVLQKGRKSLDQEALAKSGVDLSKFQKQGKPFLKFEWRKPT